MKTEIVNDIANEGIYQLNYYKKLYLTHKKINIILVIFIIILIICLNLSHVYYYSKF